MKHSIALITALTVFAVFALSEASVASAESDSSHSVSLARSQATGKVHVLKKKKKSKKKKYNCSDKKDNDHDGFVDYPNDPGCKSRKDDSEKSEGTPPPVDDGSGEVGENASLHGRRPFPDNNAWNADISGESVDSNSAALISTIGLDTGLHPDFGTVWDGAPNGIPYVLVHGSQPKLPVSFDYADESDAGPYPIPVHPPIEGGPNGQGDRHILMVDIDNWVLYELYYAFPSGSTWTAGSGAIFDLNSNALRPDSWTSADAAGLPIFPGLVRYDEVVEQGEIRHALRFTVSRSRRAYVYPATHHASSNTSVNLPPMGMRVRLKANFNISGFSPNVQVILRAMKTYGMFVADNGSNWYISGAPDSRWDDDELSTLGNVKGRDFEVVEMGELHTD